MIPTSIKKLDQILGGGIKDGLIIDIFGARGTGKTELAMQIAINSLLSGSKVFYQDTTGKFRPERMHKVIHERQLDVSLLENIQVARVTNTSEQIHYLSKIKDSNFALIIIDNITDLFSFEYSKDKLSLEKNISFMKYMRTLSLFSIQNNVPIVITNMIRTIDNKEIENLKNSIGMFTHIKIRLSKEGNKFTGNVYSPFKENKFHFVVSEIGLHDQS